jgi:leucyl/phenylalanyl-tRNA---protein transferase
MFHRERDASKIALVHLVARLRRGGFKLLDAQFMTAHLASFGAVEIERDRYHRILADAIHGEARIEKTPLSGAECLAAVVS